MFAIAINRSYFFGGGVDHWLQISAIFYCVERHVVHLNCTKNRTVIICNGVIVGGINKEALHKCMNRIETSLVVFGYIALSK
jgi:hypothetical protein